MATNTNTGSTETQGTSSRGAFRSAVSKASANLTPDLNSLESAGKVGQIISAINSLVGGFVSGIDEVAGYTIDLQHSTIAWARRSGLSLKEGQEKATRYLRETAERNLGLMYGIDAFKIDEFQSRYQDEIGRRVQITNNEMEQFGQLYNFFGEGELGTIAKASAEFSNLGMDMSKTTEYVNKMLKASKEQGLDATKASKQLLENIKMANRYGFQEGINGLNKMIQQAQTLKFDIKDTSKFADNIMQGGLENATKAAASLQVLGGNFASLGDPLALLNESFNDLAGLQNRISSMFSGLGKFDEESGMVTFNSVNRQQMMQAANALGMDYQKVLDVATRKLQVDKINDYFDTSAFGIDENIKKMITNIGTVRNGQAGAEINGEWRSVEEIAGNEDLISALKEMQGGDYQLTSIAENTNSIVDLLNKITTEGVNVSSDYYNDNLKIGYVTTGLNNLINENKSAIGGMASVSAAITKGFKTIIKIIGGVNAAGNALPTHAFGGVVEGPDHAHGGVTAVSHGSPVAEVEGGEMIVNKYATAAYRPLLDAINSSITPANPTNVPGVFANGGEVPSGGGGLISSFAELVSSVDGLTSSMSMLSQSFTPSQSIWNSIPATQQSIQSTILGESTASMEIVERFESAIASASEISDNNVNKLNDVISEMSEKIDMLINAMGDLNMKVEFGNITGTVKADSETLNVSNIIKYVLKDQSLLMELSKAIKDKLTSNRSLL